MTIAGGTIYHPASCLYIYAGALSAIGGVMIPFRVIKSIVLLRNGKEVAITTHAALLRSKTVYMPISKVRPEQKTRTTTGIIIVRL